MNQSPKVARRSSIRRARTLATPTGSVNPADAARFDVKEHVVKFEHDPPVSATIDVFPGSWGQPCREAAARPQAELKRLIDEVRTPVVQDRPGRIGTTAPTSRRRVAAD